MVKVFNATEGMDNAIPLKQGQDQLIMIDTRQFTITGVFRGAPGTQQSEDDPFEVPLENEQGVAVGGLFVLVTSTPKVDPSKEGRVEYEIKWTGGSQEKGPHIPIDP